ncbi:hypothetical protein M1P56_21420 [Streptomyces sp. HU2014]|uniref:VG15 protein n=1 Tax=Streptomyces sp. HU2014 TaxID=2939414 RepID=UPI00200CA513|nr:hypothetical protein [Streptomyces sp. HU2014]UQI46727.1 hypothetical protein M1P56_21420 [Streptomyces sp. HU2014]
METGYTLPPLDGDVVGDAVTLGELREDWARQTDTLRVPEPDDMDRVVVEEFDWPEEPREDHGRAAVASLVATGPARVREELQRLESQRDDGRGRLDAPGFLANLDDMMARTGRVAAGAADRETLRGGRELITSASREDRRALGWARITDGDPCSFCAMLVSRGAVYSSRATAASGGRRKPQGSPDGRVRVNRRSPVSREDLTRYHYLCHCQTIPVYSRTDFMTPQARDYDRQWREVTRGTTGAESLRVWRRHIDAQRSGPGLTVAESRKGRI